MLTINYMAKLRDELNCASEEIEWRGGTVEDLLTQLRDRGEPWSTTLSPANIYKVAVNNAIIHDLKVDLADNDSVALLPPVTGG